MIRAVLLVGSLWLLPILGAAQDVDSSIEQLSLHLDESEKLLKDYSFPTKSKKVHNLYLNINWQNSYAVTNSGELLQFSGRYNAMNQAVEMKLRSGIRSLQSRKIKLVVVGDNMLIPLPGTVIDLGERRVYFEILSNGDITLLKQFTLSYYMDGTNSLTAAYNGERKYQITPVYYATNDYKKLSRLKLTKKRVLQLFGDKEEEMKKFLKSNKLKLTEEKDLKRLFNAFNG
ncbi:MAG: hypothetical protein AAGG75_21410 [Bacteroidota bacterium]